MPCYAKLCFCFCYANRSRLPKHMHANPMNSTKTPKKSGIKLGITCTSPIHVLSRPQFMPVAMSMKSPPLQCCAVASKYIYPAPFSSNETHARNQIIPHEPALPPAPPLLSAPPSLSRLPTDNGVDSFPFLLNPLRKLLGAFPFLLWPLLGGLA